jgi:hypothetical protein
LLPFFIPFPVLKRNWYITGNLILNIKQFAVINDNMSNSVTDSSFLQPGLVSRPHRIAVPILIPFACVVVCS